MARGAPQWRKRRNNRWRRRPRAGLAVRMEIEQVGLSPADTGKIRACFEVCLAAQRVDEPEGPWFTERPFAGWLTVG